MKGTNVVEETEKKQKTQRWTLRATETNLTWGYFLSDMSEVKKNRNNVKENRKCWQEFKCRQKSTLITMSVKVGSVWFCCDVVPETVKLDVWATLKRNRADPLTVSALNKLGCGFLFFWPASKRKCGFAFLSFLKTKQKKVNAGKKKHLTFEQQPEPEILLRGKHLDVTEAFVILEDFWM